MRAGFVFVFILMVLALTTPIVVAVSFWMDADDMVARAEQSGALRPAAGLQPLSTPERVIAADQFMGTWAGHAFPCRTLSLLWTDLTDPESHPPSMPASQRAATAILGERRIASARWQLRRLLVACQLERRFNDAQLLRIWLAKASFGQNITGLDNAAQTILGKPSDQLTVIESAKLAALLRAPSLRTQTDRWLSEAQTISQRVTARAH